MFCRVLFIHVFLFGSVLFAQKRVADSLEKVLPTKTDTSRLRVLIKLSTAYRQSDYEKSLNYARTAYNEAVKVGNDYFIGNATIALGNVLMNNSQYDTAIVIYNSAIPFLEKANNKKGCADAYNNISYANYFKANYLVALEYALKSLTIREQLKDTFGVIGSNTNIANIYYRQKDFSKALLYYQKNLKLADAIGDDYVRGVALNNIGGVYSELKQIDTAIIYFTKAIDVRTRAGDKKGLAGTTVNLGVMYFQQKKFDLAEKYLSEGLRLKFLIKDKYGAAHAMLNLAENASAQKKYKAAIDILLKGSAIADSIGADDLRSDLYKALSDNYALQNNFQKAYEYRLLFNETKDSINSKEKEQTIAELQTKFETDKKEKENLLLKQEAEINQLRIKEEEGKAMRLYAGIALLLVLLGLSAYAYRTKMQSNKLLTLTNEQINRQNTTLKKLNTQLIESEENLVSLNATKDKLFSIISHDISNPVNAVLNYNQLMLSKAKDLSADELVGVLKKIDHSIQPLHELINNLLHWSLLQRNNPNPNIQSIELKQMVDDCCVLYKNYATQKSITINNSVDDNLQIKFDKDMLHAVIRNLLNNAIKFSHNNAEIKIYTDEQSRLIIQDNGVGMTSEQILQILNAQTLTSTHGTSNEKGTGLGLHLVKEYLILNNAQLFIESKAGAGTKFIIAFQA